APEQLLAFAGGAGPNGPTLDASTDIFALGVLLYELLAGRQPFETAAREKPWEEALALLERQQQGARPLHEVNPRVGERLSKLVHSCLEIDPGRRLTGAGELAAALRQSHRPEKAPRRWWKRIALATGGAMLVAVVAMAAAGWFSQRESELEQG